MKKVFTIFMAIAMVAGFAMSACAADVCEVCLKCELPGYIPCTQSIEQGYTGVCSSFDFDGHPIIGSPGPKQNYCTSGTNLESCRVVFEICNCPDPAEFASGEVIGIKMTLLVDNQPAFDGQGAYWEEGTNDGPAPQFAMYPSKTAACTDSRVSYETGVPVPANMTPNFGMVRYYKADGVTMATPIGPSPHACILPAANKPVMLASTAGQGYTISATDDANNLAYWVIDIPAFAIDLSEIVSGSKISVSICLLNDASGGLCGNCECICECIIDLAYVCCPASVTQYCIRYPYLVVNDEYVENGIFISNIASAPTTSGMSATLTLYDKNGNVHTATISSFDAIVNAYSVNDLVENLTWTGGAIPAGNCWLKIVANFPISGFLFTAVDYAGIYGGTTNPECCDLSCKTSGSTM